MTGLNSMERRVVEMLKGAKKIKIEFPVSDTAVETLFINIDDRAAIYRIALDVQTAWIEHNKHNPKTNTL